MTGIIAPGKYLKPILFKKFDIDINPNTCKLFTNDVFSYEKNAVTIVHSTVRSGSPMPGVLIINGNKTYGRSKNGKLLYKCVPDDKRLPPFLVPYEIKNVGFSKVFIRFICDIRICRLGR